MAHLDVYRHRNGGGYLLDVQADILASLTTRLVVPLVPGPLPRGAPARLNPIVEVDGRTLVVATQLAASAPRRALGLRVGNLDARRDDILAAFDFLITGV